MESAVAARCAITTGEGSHLTDGHIREARGETSGETTSSLVKCRRRQQHPLAVGESNNQGVRATVVPLSQCLFCFTMLPFSVSRSTQSTPSPQA